MIRSFIMHECTACNQTKIVLFTCRGKWNNDDVLQNECFVGFKFTKSALGELISSCGICDFWRRDGGKRVHFAWHIRDTGGKVRHKRSYVFKRISLWCFGIFVRLLVFFFFCKVSTGSLFFCFRDIKKGFWKNQKTNRSLSNVISFFSLMWAASLKY